MKRKIFLYCLGAVFICSTGCQKKDTVRTSAPKPEKTFGTLNGQVMHLYQDTVYVLRDNIFLNAGEQLIIDPGTLIKVSPLNNPSFIINAGAVIEANGTADNPIVFTSNEPPGSQGRNWGGISITGKSINNSTSPNGDATDLSGVLNFVRIEFAGLTLNSVGNRTIIENVQVSYADRSSFVIRGGTFNTRKLVSFSSGGAADFYITEGYSGKMQFILAYRHPFAGKAASEPFNALAGIFIENSPWNAVDARPYTYPVISNATIIGPDGQTGTAPAYTDTLVKSAALITTGSTGFLIRNSIMLGYPAGGWLIGDSLTASGLHHGLSELSHSVLHSNARSKVFYLPPGVYPPFGNTDFEGYMLAPDFHNEVFGNSNAFLLADPFNYEKPVPIPKQTSPLMEGASFDGTVFGDAFFTKVNFQGALGSDNWLSNWTNFNPLKTNYNYPR